MLQSNNPKIYTPELTTLMVEFYEDNGISVNYLALALDRSTCYN
jgi:hypothetical protein